MDAQRAEGRGEAARHEKKEGASVEDTHHGWYTEVWGTQWHGCDAQWGSCDAKWGCTQWRGCDAQWGSYDPSVVGLWQ